MPADHVTRWAVAAGCAVLLGCNRRKRSPEKESPKPTDGSRGFDAQTGSFEAVIPDDRGRIWVTVRGTEARVSDGGAGGQGAGLVKGTEAILHRGGIASLRIDAPHLVADRRKRRVEASGRVRAKSLTAGRTTALEADRMRWDDAQGVLTGEGDVLLTQDNTAKVPARRFRSDAGMTRVQLDFGPEPASGQW